MKLNKEELKELSDKDLQERLDGAVMELNQLKVNHTITPLDSPASIKQQRRNVARIQTELRVRQLNKA